MKECVAGVQGGNEGTGVEIPGWVFEEIAAYSGFDASLLGAGALLQAVSGRLAALGLQSPTAYWPLLRGGATELNSLVQALTNKETYFFREPRQFDALRDRVLPELIAGRGTDAARPELRFWSAGCSTGEEAYSLAMTLLDYRHTTGAQFDATVIGTDVDAAALERAVRGCYDGRAVRLVPDALRRRYFTVRDGRWCVVPEVADLVTFHTHNLAASCLPSDLAPRFQGSERAARVPETTLAGLDVIFCRNVTIYFREEMRERLNACLAGSLREGGYLFVASAETLGHDRGRLALVSLGGGFAFYKQPTASSPNRSEAPQPGSARPAHHASAPAARSTPGPNFASVTTRAPRTTYATGKVWAPATALAPALPPRTERRRTAPSASTAAVDRPRLEHPALQAAHRAFLEQAYDAALRHLELVPPGDVARRQVPCLRAAILLQQAQPDEANDICRRVLDEDPWHPDAYLLLALGYRQQDRAAEAVAALKQAIYLRPDDPQAHFFLGDSYRLLGLPDKARGEYENTLNILERKSIKAVDTSVDASSDTPAHAHLAGVPDDLMRRACRAQLARPGHGKGQGR